MLTCVHVVFTSEVHGYIQWQRGLSTCAILCMFQVSNTFIIVILVTVPLYIQSYRSSLAKTYGLTVTKRNIDIRLNSVVLEVNEHMNAME